MEKIHIFYTNDWHSHFAYWPRMQAYIQQRKASYEQQGDTVLLCDVGDHMDRSSIFTEATQGKGNVALLNDAGYDVVTIGNNEGITLSFANLTALYEQATFDVVVANLQAIEGQTPEWVKPYVIKTTAAGTKIGFIAATAPFEAFYRELNWDVSGAREKLIQLAYYLEDKVDILLCLSHLGLTEDEALASACPQIDVIFGSHTHHVLPKGKLINGVLLTGGGMFGRYLGELTLTFDDNGLTKQTVLHESKTLPPLDNETSMVAKLTAIGEQKLQKTAFISPKFYNKEWYHYSKLSHLFAAMMLEETDADCALFNAGIFLTDLPKGPISALDLHRLLPHPINLCIIEVTAQQLKELLAEDIPVDWPRMALKGLGFRGVVLGKILTYGFTLDDKRRLWINGELADEQKVYRLVTLDLFTFGYFYPQFNYAKKHYVLPEFLRELFLAYGQHHFAEERK